MGFWAKLKQRLGIGGIKLNLSVGAQAPKDGPDLRGAVTLTSKSDQLIEALHFKLIEKYTTGRGDDEKTKEFELGKISQANPIAIRAGESKTIDFTLPFESVSSVHDKLKAKGGTLGALGKASSFLAKERSEYEVWVNADVKGTSFGPNDFKGIQLV
jgi:hypothetical protein